MTREPSTTSTDETNNESRDETARTADRERGGPPSQSASKTAWEVPPDAVACSRCGEPFPFERLRDLHRGIEHYDELTDTEREAFNDAYLSETEELRSFRLRALAALVLLYFGFLFTYAIFTIG